MPPRSPGAFKKTEIKPGEFILAIDKQRVSANEHLWEMLNLKKGAYVEFTVNSKPEMKDARTVKYKLMTSSEWKAMQYRNWITDLARNFSLDQRVRCSI